MWGETIVVTRPGAETSELDEQGNPIRSASITFSIDGVAVAPGSLDEQAELYGPRSTNACTLYRRQGVLGLEPDDLIEIRGVAGWQVVADPDRAEWRNPYRGSMLHGSVAEVRRSS